MKACGLILSAGLVSAQVLNNGLNLGVDALLNGSFDSSAVNFDPAALGLNLGDLNVQGLDINNLNLNNQDAMAQAIQALLGNLCLNNALDVNSILGLGANNQLDLFFQLAQLQQLNNLGFLGLGGINNLFNSGFALGGGFNLGVFKREVAKAKKSMKRFKLRRGMKVTKRQCQGINQGVGNVNAAVDGTVAIATAPVNVAAVTPAVASAPPVAVATAPAVAVATPVAVAPVASVAPVAVAPAPAPVAAVPAQPVASVAPAAAPAGEENLADFTR